MKFRNQGKVSKLENFFYYNKTSWYFSQNYWKVYSRNFVKNRIWKSSDTDFQWKCFRNRIIHKNFFVWKKKLNDYDKHNTLWESLTNFEFYWNFL